MAKFDEEFKAQAMRLVRDHVGEYPSEWAAISAVAYRLGVSAETLRVWLRQQEGAASARRGAAGADGSAESEGSAAEIRELKRKNAELERTIEILKAASAFFLREWCATRRCACRGVVRDHPRWVVAAA
jgi:transposase